MENRHKIKNRNEYLQLPTPEHDLPWDAILMGSVVSTVELPLGIEPSYHDYKSCASPAML